jgi:hypothetical protein
MRYELNQDLICVAKIGFFTLDSGAVFPPEMFFAVFLARIFCFMVGHNPIFINYLAL